MKTYARIVGGAVVELITPGMDLAGNQYPIEECFPAEIIAECVDISGISPQPGQRWVYDGAAFSPEPVVVPTPAEMLASNRATLAALKTHASQVMTPLLLSLQLDEATEAEIAEAKLWQEYSRKLKLVDIAVAAPEWPVSPE